MVTASFDQAKKLYRSAVTVEGLSFRYPGAESDALADFIIGPRHQRQAIHGERLTVADRPFRVRHTEGSHHALTQQAPHVRVLAVS